MRQAMTQIEDMIERCRPYAGDSWSRFERNALVGLARLGVESFDQVLLFAADSRDYKNRYTAWLYESLVWTIGRIREERNHEALRGFCQICDYSGRLKGFWPDPLTGDAYLTLRNHFEDLLKPR